MMNTFFELKVHFDERTQNFMVLKTIKNVTNWKGFAWLISYFHFQCATQMRIYQEMARIVR